MKAEYSVEEKLERIEAVIQGLRPSHDGYITQAVGLLRDYSECIKADEGAVPTFSRSDVSKWRGDAFENAAQIVDRYAKHFPEVTGAADDIRALIAHPPAQATQVDAFADRLRQSIMRDTFQPTAEPVVQGEVFMHVLASLIAAVSLLRHGGRKAAPSDTMFAFMLSDYEKAIKAGRALLAAPQPGESE